MFAAFYYFMAHSWLTEQTTIGRGMQITAI